MKDVISFSLVINVIIFVEVVGMEVDRADSNRVNREYFHFINVIQINFL